MYSLREIEWKEGMAHRIESDDMLAFRMSEGKPWHGIGVPISDDAPDETLFAESGLGKWNPILYDVGIESKKSPGTWKGFDGWKAVVRSDNGKVLSVVTDSYRPVLNRDIWDFFSSFCSETGAHLSTAGSLCNGRRVWALAKLPNSFTLGERDRTDMYVCLSTGHDASFATQADLTTIRVVCHNTLDATRGRAGKAGDGARFGRFRLTHLGRWTPSTVRQAQRVMRDAITALEFQHERAMRLYETRVDGDVQRAYLAELFAPEIIQGILEGRWGNKPVKLDDAIAETQAEAGRRVIESLTLSDATEQAEVGQRVLECIVDGLNHRVVRTELARKHSYQEVSSLLGKTPGFPESRGTLWDTANTVTYWADHVRGRDASAAIESALWGQSRDLKVSAMSLADQYFSRITGQPVEVVESPNNSLIDF